MHILNLFLLLFLALGTHAAGASNPHWKAGACTTCHNSDTPTAELPMLKTTPGAAVCGECHGGGDAAVCRHRSDIAVVAERAAEFDVPLQSALGDGSVVCTTCHEMTAHCARDVKQRYRNPSMLRGAPFDSRSDQCFGCHERSGYRQPIPHRQGRKNRFKESTCIFCHEVVPEKDADGQWMPVNFATDKSLSKLCNGCHSKGPHPSSSVTGKTGWMHLTVPNEEFKERMKQTVETKGGRLPLDPTTGEIFCANCHDPHDQRLAGFAIAETPGTKAKLRYKDICGACHEK
jgi:predicted CXXCH cytochrome family protein